MPRLSLSLSRPSIPLAASVILRSAVSAVMKCLACWVKLTQCCRPRPCFQTNAKHFQNGYVDRSQLFDVIWPIRSLLGFSLIIKKVIYAGVSKMLGPKVSRTRTLKFPCPHCSVFPVPRGWWSDAGKGSFDACSRYFGPKHFTHSCIFQLSQISVNNIRSTVT